MNCFLPFKHRFLFKVLALICTCSWICLPSCKKDLESEIGQKLQPDDESLFAVFDDTTACLQNLTAYTVASDSGITSGVYALGSYNHPDFGTMTANIITQIAEYNTEDSVYDIFAVDSVVLKLAYSSAYPFDEKAPLNMHPITISIETLTQSVHVDSSSNTKQYYSNQDFIHHQGSTLPNGLPFTFTPNLRDSVVDPLDSTAKVHNPILQIPLDVNYGMSLLNASRDHLTDNDFIDRIKGLYIKTHPETMDGNGNIVFFDFFSTSGLAQIVVYYRASETDTVSTAKQYNLGFSNTGSMTYTYIHTDRSTASTDYTNQLAGDTASGTKSLFLQSFFSSAIHVKLPENIRDFKNVANGKQIVINQACLVMSVDEDYGRFTPPASLKISYDSIYSLRDQTSIGYIDGTFNKNKSEYRFYLTLHIQKLLMDDQMENFPLTISTNDEYTPNLVKIKGADKIANGNKRMRLEIVYSVLP